MNTRLFIENREIELDETVQFAITKQFEDLSNPTIIINDWSKTVSIPFTARNNAIFGYIYNPDRLIVSGTSDTLTGIYFDPYKKLDMRLQYGDNVIMVGYAKMNEVKMEGTKSTYEITLFGQLGKIFQELKKISPIKTQVDEDKYYIGNVFEHRIINKDIVKECWNNEPDLSVFLKYAKTSDIIGFCPTDLGITENFDCNSIITNGAVNRISEYKVQCSDGETRTLEDAYKARNYDISPLIKDGLTQQQMGQFRSYLLTPYIYTHRLFEILKNKCKELTDYDLRIDEEWTSKNPYYNNSVMFLERLPIKEDVGYYGDCVYCDWNPSKTYYTLGQESPIYIWDVIQQEPIAELKKGPTRYGTELSFNLPEHDTVTLALELPLRLDITLNAYDNQLFNLSKDTKFVIDTILTGQNGYTETLKNNLYAEDTDLTPSDSLSDNNQFLAGVDMRTFVNQGGFLITLPIYCVMNRAKFGEKVTIRIKPRFEGNTSEPLRDMKTGNTYAGISRSLRPQGNRDGKATGKLYNTVLNFRSDCEFKFGDLWNAEYNFFDCILNYTKIHRLGWLVDDNERTITIKPLSKILKEELNYIPDITNKFDFSSSHSIKPIYFENYGVKFNYNDSKTDLNELYKERHGVNYGEYRILGVYNFNNNIKNLFDGVNVAIEEQLNTITFNDLVKYAETNFNPGLQAVVQGKFKGNTYVCSREKNKETSIFGAYMLYLGNITNDSSIIPKLYVTDDSYNELANAVYTYHNTFSADEEVTKLPYITNFYDIGYVLGYDEHTGDEIIDHRAVMSTYSVPATVFFNLPGARDVYHSLYDIFWDKYIDGELLNQQTKLITGNLRITTIDFERLKNHRFVTYGNQLCILNKISDFDLDNGKYRCELLTVNNIDNYTDTSYYGWITNNSGYGYYLDNDRRSGMTHRFFYSESDTHTLKIECSNKLVQPTITRVGNTNYWDVTIPETSISFFQITLYYEYKIGGATYMSEINTTTFGYRGMEDNRTMFDK